MWLASSSFVAPTAGLHGLAPTPLPHRQLQATRPQAPLALRQRYEERHHLRRRVRRHASESGSSGSSSGVAVDMPDSAVEHEASSDDSWGFLDQIPGVALTAIAGVGAADAGYLLLVKLGFIGLTCPTDASGASCEAVLNSQWASIGPVPLPALGLLAYTAVGVMGLRPGWRESTDLFVLCLAMAIASLLLLGILLAVLKATCFYCALSAFVSAMLLGLVAAIQGRKTEFYSRRRGIALAGVVAAGAAADVVAFPGGRSASEDGEDFYSLAQRYKPEHPPVRSASTPATVALARHLKEVGAKCYSAWWCPHCQEQRENFGAEAVELGPFVECSKADGKQNDVCKAANIDGYPQWVIGGETYKGAQPLPRLAELSGFKAFPPDAFQEVGEEATAYIWS
mmetsp:Transcript_54407/g.126986  ORF Transcript_54407/g.126986 Transcript_54407/m.126986 type:complete len:397 (+) Transcript_54407:48-1238(+)